MGDPFVIACIALGLSVVASAVRMVDWFLHADPRIAARVTRWGAQGIAALSVPLLASAALQGAMDRGDRTGLGDVARSSRARSTPVASGSACRRSRHKFREAPPHGRSPTRPSLSGIRRPCSRRICAAPPRRRRRSAAMCRRLRTTPTAMAAPMARGRRPQKATAEAATRTVTAMLVASPMRSGIGDAATGNGHAESFGLGAMSEEEACAVLGVDRGAGVAEIRAAHGRISAVVEPAQGGSPYLAIKVDQAKAVLVRAAAPSANAPSRAPRKRSASRRRASPPA